MIGTSHGRESPGGVAVTRLRRGRVTLLAAWVVISGLALWLRLWNFLFAAALCFGYIHAVLLLSRRVLFGQISRDTARRLRFVAMCVVLAVFSFSVIIGPRAGWWTW